MTRNEILKFISERPGLAEKINNCEGKNFTNVKTAILEEYLNDYNWFIDNEKKGDELIKSEAVKSAVIAFLVTLDQKGLLSDLLAEIKYIDV